MTDQPLPPNRIGLFAVWRWKRRWKIIAAVSLLAPVPLYALSIGPAVMLVGADYIAVSTAADIYRPLFRLHETLPPQYGELLLKYMRQWDDGAGKLVYFSDALEREAESCRSFD